MSADREDILKCIENGRLAPLAVGIEGCRHAPTIVRRLVEFAWVEKSRREAFGKTLRAISMLPSNGGQGCIGTATDLAKAALED